jgi:predicted ATPase/DNA-binding winged helix-turn-helix (wHTH) protein
MADLPDPEAPARSGPQALTFGPGARFQLQPAERRLLIDGRPAAITPRALDVLIALTAQPDHLVSKGELLDQVWRGLVVEEANLHVQISALRKLLGGDVIATVPGRGYRFAAPLSAPPAPDLPAATATTAVTTTSAMPALAAASRLIGRDADLARLEAALRPEGIVTLAGISGVGKTSLARVAFQRWAGRRAWADLAAVAAGQAIADTVARALGAPLDEGEALPQLRRAVAGEPLLLVLDNAEHLVDDCAALVSRLGPMSNLCLLITSQVPLALADEQVQRLEPLALAAPSAQADAPAQGSNGVADIEALGDGALALLVKRIVAADHRFRLTAAAWPLLHGICAHLDGLPLAIEMAASRVPTLGLHGVHEALAQRFSLLTQSRRDAAQRHRTLHDAVAWSYQLLDDPAQRLWRTLGVFVGGFTVDLAVALRVGPGHGANDDEARWEVIDTLARLVDRSLVAVSADDPPRYRLLDTLRAFARQQTRQAQAPGECEADVQRAHALALLELLRTYTPGNHEVAQRCSTEMPNLLAAIEWALGAGELALAADLSARMTGVATFTPWRYAAGQCLVALEPAMRQAPEGALPADVAARWWGELARTLIIRGDARGTEAAERAHARRLALDDADRTLYAACVWLRSIPAPGPDMDRALAAVAAAALSQTAPLPATAVLRHGSLALAAYRRGDMHEAIAQHEAELAIAEAQGFVSHAEVAETNLLVALANVNRGDEATARGLALLSRVPEDSGNLPWLMSIVLHALVQQGRIGEALALLPRGWQAFQRFDVPNILPRLAWVVVAQRRFDAGARLLSHARQAYAQRGITPDSDDRETFAAIDLQLHEALDTGRLAMLEREGRLLSDEAARALALDA